MRVFGFTDGPWPPKSRIAKLAVDIRHGTLWRGRPARGSASACANAASEAVRPAGGPPAPRGIMVRHVGLCGAGGPPADRRRIAGERRVRSGPARGRAARATGDHGSACGTLWRGRPARGSASACANAASEAVRPAGGPPAPRGISILEKTRPKASGTVAEKPPWGSNSRSGDRRKLASASNPRGWAQTSRGSESAAASRRAPDWAAMFPSSFP